MSNSISELIYDHFAGLEPKDKTQPLLKRVPTGRYAALSLTSLKNKALSTLCANAYKGKKRDFCQDALSALSDTTLKTTVGSDGKFDVQFEFRKLDKIKKDFWQLATAGIFPGDVQEKLKMIEDVKAKKNAGYKSFGAFVGNDDYWKIKSSCNQTDAKLLQLMNENGEVVIDWANKRLHFTSASLFKNKKFDIKDVTAAIFASNLQTLEDKAAAMYNDGDLIEPAVQLASILFIQAVTEQADLKDGNDVPSEFAEKMLPFLYESMPNLSDEDNETVRQMAFELANERIQELNNVIEAHNKLSSKPLEKYPDIKQFYHDTQVYRLLDQKINKFQDLPIKWAKEGSNYLWRVLDENGVVSEVYVEDKDLIKDGDFQEAFKRLESNDEDKILSAFEFFDREIAKTTKSKAINNFEEAASAIFSNLILLSYASEKAKKVAQNAVKLLDSIGAPHTICEIGKERIRRAGDKIKEDNPLGTQSLDIGFRVFRVDSSNMKDVYYQPEELDQQSMFDLVSNIKDDRTDLDLLYACLLDWGVEIHLPHTSTDLDGCTVHNVDNGALMACFSPNVPRSVVEYMAKQQPLRAVFRDNSFAADDAKINVTEIFKNLSPDTKVKVI